MRKAHQHLSTARRAFVANEYDAAVGTAAIAGIHASDAVTLWTKGMRSASASHAVAVDVLRGTAVGSRMSDDLAELLGIKNIAQYGEVEMSAEDARRTLEAAQRMVDEANKLVGGSRSQTRDESPASPGRNLLARILSSQDEAKVIVGAQCGAWMPVARKHCVLSVGHARSHRSAR